MLVNGFKWVKDLRKLDEGSIKCYNEKRKEGYFLEVGIQCPEYLHKAQNDLAFLHKRIKIGKFEELVASLPYKTEYDIHIKNLTLLLLFLFLSLLLSYST